MGRPPSNERLVSTPFSAQMGPKSDLERLRGTYDGYGFRRAIARRSWLTLGATAVAREGFGNLLIHSHLGRRTRVADRSRSDFRRPGLAQRGISLLFFYGFSAVRPLGSDRTAPGDASAGFAEPTTQMQHCSLADRMPAVAVRFARENGPPMERERQLHLSCLAISIQLPHPVTPQPPQRMRDGRGVGTVPYDVDDYSGCGLQNRGPFLVFAAQGWGEEELRKPKELRNAQCWEGPRFAVPVIRDGNMPSLPTVAWSN